MADPALDTTPTRAGFLVFIRAVMGIDSAILPDNSAWIDFSLGLSLEWVNTQIGSLSSVIYTQAVYNLGGSFLLNYTPDQSGATPVAGSEPPAAFFAFTRRQLNVNGFVAGVIQSAGDEGTNESMVVQKAFETLTLADLQQLKDPYGRAYLAIAQQMGDLWGLI